MLCLSSGALHFPLSTLSLSTPLSLHQAPQLRPWHHWLTLTKPWGLNAPPVCLILWSWSICYTGFQWTIVSPEPTTSTSCIIYEAWCKMQLRGPWFEFQDRTAEPGSIIHAKLSPRNALGYKESLRTSPSQDSSALCAQRPDEWVQSGHSRMTSCSYSSAQCR